MVRPCSELAVRRYATFAMFTVDIFSYSSVRIDAVHFCGLEEALTKKRQRKSFRKSAVEPGDVPGIRLSHFCNTVRESPELASRVEILKLPQMTRETSKSELARTVSVLPNLKYVDLPNGIRDGDPACHTLATELQARCPNIRKAVYTYGAEATLYSLIDGHWPRLETLALSAMALEAGPLRNVLAVLTRLSDLTIANDDRLDDSIFYSSRPSIADFPALRCLTMTDMPHITASGLRNYMSQNDNSASLKSLALNYTGITVQDLHTIIPHLHNLTSFTFSDTVSRPMDLHEHSVPVMSSKSIQTAKFDIIVDRDAHGLQSPSESYYEYLAQCLHGNEFPALDQLYVHDPNFGDRLLSAAQSPPLSGMDNLRLDEPGPRGIRSLRKPSLGFNRRLNIYFRGIDDLEYTHTLIDPSAQDHIDTLSDALRPTSSYSVVSRGAGMQWASPHSRSSAIAVNGFGGFLAVPIQDDSRPGSRVGSGHGMPNKVDHLSSPAMASAVRGSYARSRSPSPAPRAARFPGSTSRSASPHIGSMSRSPDPSGNAFPSFHSTGRASGAYLAAANGSGGGGSLGLGHSMKGRSRSESGPALHFANAAASGGDPGAVAAAVANSTPSPSASHLMPSRPRFLRSHSSGPLGERDTKKDKKEREDLWR